MGNMSILTIFLAALAFFVVGALWYGVLFARPWQRAAGLSDETIASTNMPFVFALAFAFELLISLVLAHQYAMTGPSDRAKMMIAIGYGVGIMVPAIGITYLFLRKPGHLFLIDAGHFIVGMAAMGGVYALVD